VIFNFIKVVFKSINLSFLLKVLLSLLSMNILYRDVPENVYNLICDKQNEMQKKKKQKVSQSTALTALLKALSKTDKKENE